MYFLCFRTTHTPTYSPDNLYCSGSKRQKVASGLHSKRCPLMVQNSTKQLKLHGTFISPKQHLCFVSSPLGALSSFYLHMFFCTFSRCTFATQCLNVATTTVPKLKQTVRLLGTQGPTHGCHFLILFHKIKIHLSYGLKAMFEQADLKFGLLRV